MRTYQRGCPMLLYCPHPGELCRGSPVLEGRREGGLSGCCWHRGAPWLGALGWAVYLAVKELQGRLSSCFTFCATARARGLCSHGMNPVGRWGYETGGTVQSPVGLGAGRGVLPAAPSHGVREAKGIREPGQLCCVVLCCSTGCET